MQDDSEQRSRLSPFRVGQNQCQPSTALFRDDWLRHGEHPFGLSEWGFLLLAPGGKEIPHSHGEAATVIQPSGLF